MPRDYAVTIPERVLVRFPVDSNGLANRNYYVKEIEAAAAGAGTDGHFDGEKIFHDSCWARYAPSGSLPTNQTALDALALQIARDYYRWRADHRDTTYCGVVAWEMDGTTDNVEWTYTAGDCQTRTMSAPYSGETEELFHGEAVADPDFSNASIRYAVTGSGGIGPRAGLTLGSATVRIYTKSGVTITNTGPSVGCTNGGSTAVGANRLIVIAKINGGYECIWEDCSGATITGGGVGVVGSAPRPPEEDEAMPFAEDEIDFAFLAAAASADPTNPGDGV